MDSLFVSNLKYLAKQVWIIILDNPFKTILFFEIVSYFLFATFVFGQGSYSYDSSGGLPILIMHFIITAINFFVSFLVLFFGPTRLGQMMLLCALIMTFLGLGIFMIPMM